MDTQGDVLSAIITCCTTKQGTICRGWVVLCNSIFKRMVHTCKLNVATAAIAARVESMDKPHASEEEYTCGNRPQAITVLLREIRDNFDEKTRAQYTPMLVLLFAVRESCNIPEVRQFASMVFKDLTMTSRRRQIDVPSPRYYCIFSDDTTAHANTVSFVAADGIVLTVVMANKVFEEVSRNHSLSNIDTAKIDALVKCLLAVYNACTHGGSAIVAAIKDVDLVAFLMQTIAFVNRIDHIDEFMQTIALLDRVESMDASSGATPLFVEERGACDSLLVMCYRLLFLLSNCKLLGYEYMRQYACIGGAFAQLRQLSFRQTFRPFPVLGELCCKIVYRLCEESSDSTLEVDHLDHVNLLVRVLVQTKEYPDAVESITGLLHHIVSTHRDTSSMIVETDGGIGILQSLLQDDTPFGIMDGPTQSATTHCNVMKILTVVCFDDHRQGNLLASKDMVVLIMYYITIYTHEEFLMSAAGLLEEISVSNYNGETEINYVRRAFMCEGTVSMMHADSPIGIMLAVIKRRPHDCALLTLLYIILSNLCNHTPEARSRIIELGGVQRALETLTVEHSKHTMVHSVLKLLRVLTADAGYARYAANVISTLRSVMDAAGPILFNTQQTIMDALPELCDADPAGLDPVLWYTQDRSISSLVLANMQLDLLGGVESYLATVCTLIVYMFTALDKTEDTIALRHVFKLRAIPQILTVMHIKQNSESRIVRMYFESVLWQFALDDQERVCVDTPTGREEAIRHVVHKYTIDIWRLLIGEDDFLFPVSNFT